MIGTAKLALVSLLALIRFHSIHISYAKAEVEASSVHFRVSYYKDDYMRSLDGWYSGKTRTFSAEQLRDAEVAYFKEYARLWSGKNFTHPLSMLLCYPR
jgi:hypothetical protein